MRKARTPKLRNHPIFKDCFWLAERVYDELDANGENFSEAEEWNTKSKLRNSANDALFNIAMACGSRAPGGSEYEWNTAKKQLAGLLAMYLFAGRRHFVVLDPEVVMKLESLLDVVDTEILSSHKEAKQRDLEETEPWLQRYRIWEEMNGKEDRT